MNKNDIKKKIFGFTLIELLTVIAIISVLLGILLPVLHRVKESVRQVVCSSNLSQISKAMMVYISDTTFYPAAYLYENNNTEDTRIIHWSGKFVDSGLLSEDVFHCPSVLNGGLPPAHTSEDNVENEQINVAPELEDVQVRRCSYTVNEALLPRNRFKVGFEKAYRVSRYVSDVQVQSPSDTILVTEWTDNWLLLSQDGVCRSYMPVHAFQGIGPMGSDRYDLNLVGSISDRPCLEESLFRRVGSDLLSSNPNPSRKYPSRLDWVGRFHKGNAKQTNFLYTDGHVECKSIYDTLDKNFEWGRAIYSIEGGERIFHE